MKRVVFFILLIAAGRTASAQKIDSIYFHLYTDSLKKGFYNYINVDGKTSTGNWVPLSSNEIIFSANDTLLTFQNNDLFIDSAYKKETVTVRAALKANPRVYKEITIFIRKRGFDEPLKTSQEILDEYSKPQKAKAKNLTSFLRPPEI